MAIATLVTMGIGCMKMDMTTAHAHHEEWDFGDAATATGTTVTHDYNKTGTFSVKLSAYNEYKSKSDIKTATITITQ